MNKLSNNNSGHTLVELLIAMFLTGIISMAGLQFYVSIHNQTLAQEDVSDMQNAARASLDEIAKTLRQAGYKIGAHAPYALIGDTLLVFYSDTQAVDTVAYYLMSEGDLSTTGRIATQMLMKRINSNQGDIFTDGLESVAYTVISPSVIDVVVTATANRPDENYTDNDGIRTLTVAERVQMRNLNL